MYLYEAEHLLLGIINSNERQAPIEYQKSIYQVEALPLKSNMTGVQLTVQAVTFGRWGWVASFSRT